MKTLYLDLFSGISGDMFLGALLDLGVDSAALQDALSRLALSGYHLHIHREQKSGITGTRFDVHVESASAATDAGPIRRHHADATARPNRHAHPAAEGSRDFAQIKTLIQTSPLSNWIKEKALAAFGRIASAEGKIHGVPLDQVHFHEVGALDSIIDVVGACVALDLLGRPRVLASTVVDGTGWVACAHGQLPVPVPATLEILAARGVAISQCDEPHELVTPTGAGLLAEFVEEFGAMPGLQLTRIGYGLGARDNRTRPNVLRAILGETPAKSPPGDLDWEADSVAVLETNLDDLSPEILAHFAEQTLAAGALDVFHTPVQMKKGRPGVLLTVLCAAADADRFSASILRETSAFGVRRTLAERRKLRREFRRLQTEFGEVTVKLGLLGGQTVQAAPEYESCRQAAARAAVPVKQVYQAALRSLENGNPL